jgi:hypothetical protein
MSENQIPAEFEWIKPGVKATCQKSKRNVIITRDIDHSADGFGGQDWFVSWCYDGSVYGGSNCKDLTPGHTGNVTLTLTREQAEQLIEDFSTSKITRSMDDLKQMIKEKLK